MKSFRTRVNRVKNLFPNFFYRSNEYYNFCHEIRETQRHTFYNLLKATFLDYIHSGEVNLRIAENEIERLTTKKQWYIDNPIDGMDFRTLNKQIQECNEAISFLKVLSL